MQIRRRSFIRYASLAAAGNLAGLRPFGAMNALAATVPDYKALVCDLFVRRQRREQHGVPYDTAGYSNYAALRTANGSSIAIPQASLLPLTPLPNFALHPSLPDVQTLFNNGNAAIVANVGTLTQPITRAEYLAGGKVPSNLFFASRPAGGVAERCCGRGHFNGLGRPRVGCADRQLQRRGNDSDGHFGLGRHAFLQWSFDDAGVGVPGKSG
jgi:hypothetical protein